MPTIPSDPSQADPSIIALMHGIVANEGSGGDPTKLGDKDKSGNYTAAGIGQWSNEVNGTPQPLQPGQIPTNFVGDAKQYGLDPTDFSLTNQNKVMYARLADDKSKGLQPEQILSKWNSGDPNKYLSGDASGTGSVGPYNVASYVKNGMAAAQKFAQSQQAQTGNNSGGNTGNQAPESTLQKAGDVAGAIGNFLFPIAGDIGADIQGKADKTPLQQTGDLALSALPFIPGLGEVGEAAKGADAVAEGAEAAKGSGLLSKVRGLIGANPITAGAVSGYGTGVASNLSQGQSVGQSLMPNINTISGAVLGGGGSALVKGLGGLAKGASGITPQIENALKDSGISVEQYNQYIDAAKARSQDVRAPAPLELAANQLDTAGKKITAAREAAGQAVGDAKKLVGNRPVGDVQPIIDNFNQQVEDKYGIAITKGKNGSITALKVPGSMREVPPGVRTRVIQTARQLEALKGGSLGQASDIAANISDLVDYSKKDLYGNTNDPLEGLLKNTDGGIRTMINNTSPEMAQANANFSGLKGLEGEMSGMAGKNLQKGEMLMKRVFSGDKSGDVQNLFGKIKAVTGIDLVNHAVLAKHAIDVAGDASQKSLLEQMIEGGIATHTGGLAAGLAGLAKGAAKKTFANPETLGREAVKGKTGLLKLLGKTGITSGAIQASRVPGMLSAPKQ